MRTVVLGPPPAELTALIARRRDLGLDMYDEVWEGEYHMAPGPSPAHAWLQAELIRTLSRLAAPVGLEVLGPTNIGRSDDFRVPDVCLVRSLSRETFLPTAAIVVEVRSPHDETWAKFDFYARHRVEEMLVLSPEPSAMRWFLLEKGEYRETDVSGLLGPESAGVIGTIRWPGSATD